MKRVYEIEIQRTNVTPKQFWNYCKKQMEKKGIDNSVCPDDFDDWAAPYQECNSYNKHEDWDVPQIELIRIKPFDMHLFLQNCWNFIMEFTFDDEKTGVGYMYATEFEN